jgi:hypothetical protein
MSTDVVRVLLASWQQSRAALRVIEEAEHPDVTDAFGRVWVWKDKDLYTHDGMAWPLGHVTNKKMSLPTDQALQNPNYQWCSICMGGGR